MTEYDKLIALAATFGLPTADQVQAFAKENPNDWEAMLRYLRLAIEVLDRNIKEDADRSYWIEANEEAED